MRRFVGRRARPLLAQALCLLLAGLPAGCGGSEGRGAVAPTLVAVAPETGPAAGGTALFLNGSGFLRSGLRVSVGGVPAVGVSVLNDETLTCVTPPGVPGVASVAVTTSGGAAAMPQGFRYRDRFEGDYFLSLFDGLAFGTPTALSQWGSLRADGAGNVSSGVVLTNDSGSIGGPIPLPPIEYTISQANRLSTPGAVPLLEGGIAESGRAAALGLVGEGDPTGFMLLGRSGEEISTNASFAGGYHVCAFSFDPVTGEDEVLWGTLHANGSGRGTASTSRNLAGDVTGPAASNLTYVVLPDGTLTLLWRGLALRGGLLAGGELALASGGTEAGTRPCVAVLVREGQGLSQATFQGTYHFVSLAGTAGGPGPRWTTSTGTALVDGGGRIVIGEALTNADGRIENVGSGGRLDYVVGPDGRFESAGGRVALRGGIVSAGDYGCWAGSLERGEAPQIWVWLR